jgi:hypothetical protein
MELATASARVISGAKWWQMQNREARLVTAVRAGRQFKDIARELGTGTSAICGKVHRMGIGPGRPNYYPGLKAPKAEKKQAFAPPDVEFFRIDRAMKEEANRRQGLTVALVDSEDHHCRFVIGEPSDGQICGVRRHKGLPYCSEHAALCYGIETPDSRESQPERVAAA